MSSKSAGEPAQNSVPWRYWPLSIALRMTLWYALSTFAVMAVATASLYLVLVDSMYREDIRDLADNLNNARLLLQSTPAVNFPPSGEHRPSWAPPGQPEIYLRVLDRDAKVLTETPGMGAELPVPTAATLATITRAEGERRTIVSRSGKPFLSLTVPVPNASGTGGPWFMQVAMNREHDEHLLARYRNRMWLVLGGALLICSLVGHLIARGGMRPIRNIADTAARIRAMTLHERIDTQGLPSELRDLAETFNGMLDRLQESFRYVSQFSDDVAHELRTPINNLRGEIEVALSRSRSGEEYRGILESCLEECSRISRLIRTLLFLARSDTREDALQRERVEVGRELRKIESYFEASAAEASVNLNVSAADGLVAEVDRTLFQQAIGNLVSNAIAHTPAGGRVILSAKADRSQLTVGVTDTGCGIGSEHLPRIFERFYRIDRARSGSAENAGLGLAVVKSIVARHGGQVEVESELGRGTEVRLILPAAA
jgi:two-component system heavy metal sensor histidine kinase CusS